MTQTAIQTLEELAQRHGTPLESEALAAVLDAQDELASFRNEFYIPLVKDLPCNQHMSGKCPQSQRIASLSNIDNRRVLEERSDLPFRQLVRLAAQMC
jgi:hypothetical protein